MDADEQSHIHRNVEQSWIVLDDNGWVSASRPPTASPNRRTPKFDEEDEDGSSGTRLLRRIGMDRDVREALELAERSLEIAGTSDEFSHVTNRTLSDDEDGVGRLSPLIKYVADGISGLEDKYNGRGDPTVRGNNPKIIIATDAEHVAFKTIRPPPEDRPAKSPIAELGDIHGPDPLRCDSRPSSIENSGLHVMTNPRPNAPQADEPIEPFLKYDEDEPQSLFQWALGIYGGPNMVPLVLSHALTLVIGFYLGSRRTAISSSPGPSGSQNVGALQSASNSY